LQEQSKYKLMLTLIFCDDEANSINEGGEINEDANICRSGSKHGGGVSSFFHATPRWSSLTSKRSIGTQRNAAPFREF
jgi:hypothetical protein